MAELGLAIVVANRIVNQLAAKSLADPILYSPTREEPALIELEIVEIRQGSVILEALTQILEQPLAADLAVSVAGAAIYDKVPGVVRAAARALGRLTRAASEKTLVISIRIGNSAYQIRSSFSEGRMQQRIMRIPPDDLQ